MDSQRHQIYGTTKKIMLKKDGDRIMQHWINELKTQLEDVEAAYATVKEEMFDWSVYITQAKKRFSNLDIAILEALVENEEFCLNYADIEYALSERDDFITLALPSNSKPLVRRRVRRMMRIGIVRMVSGLWNEDGMPAGSGFDINPNRWGTVRQIISVYRHENLKLDI